MALILPDCAAWVFCGPAHRLPSGSQLLSRYGGLLGQVPIICGTSSKRGFCLLPNSSFCEYTLVSGS